MVAAVEGYLIGGTRVDDGCLRGIHFMPPGSGGSTIFGKNITTAAPISDVEAAAKPIWKALAFPSLPPVP